MFAAYFTFNLPSFAAEELLASLMHQLCLVAYWQCQSELDASVQIHPPCCLAHDTAIIHKLQTSSQLNSITNKSLSITCDIWGHLYVRLSTSTNSSSASAFFDTKGISVAGKWWNLQICTNKIFDILGDNYINNLPKLRFINKM